MRTWVVACLCFTAPLAAQAVIEPGPPTAPLTAAERLEWAALSTVGAPNLGGGLFKAGFQTLVDDPEEYDTHWKGFGKRYALRLSGNATSNLMEASVGAMWGEDPRYHRAESTSVKGRLWNVVRGVVFAYDEKGDLMPAYARYLSVPASNVLSNAWRPDSQRTVAHTTMRVSIGLVSRAAANAFEEFWPDVKKYVFRMKP